MLSARRRAGGRKAAYPSGRYAPGRALRLSRVATEIGESIAGSYLRYIVGCEVVVYNTQTARQGELDVIGIRTATPRDVWLCEVATHLEGLEYGADMPAP